MGVSLASPVGFFPSWIVSYTPAGLPFLWEEGEAEAETADGEGLEILPEVRHQQWRCWEAGWRQIIVGAPC